MPRMGMGMPLVATAQSSAVNIEDVLWENYSDSSGEIAINYQQTRTNLVRHSNFATDAIWSKTNATISASNKEATISITNGVFSFISIPVSYTSGQTYTLSAEINGTAGKEMRFQDIANNSGGLTTSNAVITMTGQPQEISITWVANANSSHINVARNTAAGNYSFTVKNVQVEEGPEATAFIITGTNAAAAVTTTLNDTHDIWDFDNADLMPEEDPDSEGVWERPSNIVLNHDYADLGANVVVNGDFDTDSDWIKDTGWTISGGSGNCDGSQTGNSNLTPNADNVENGLLYRVTYSISNYSSGSIRIKLGNTGHGQFNSGNGTYTEEIKAVVTTFPRSQINADSSFIGSIDNISVKQIDPNDRWTKTGLATIENGVAKFLDDGTNANSSIIQSGFPANTTYELVFAITRYVAGRIIVLISSDSYNVDISGGVGTYTVIIQPAGSTSLTIKRDGSFPGFDFDIDNVTLKEYAITPLDV